MSEIIWTRAAEADLLAVYDTFENLRQGSGDELLSLIDDSIQMLKQFPHMAPVFEAPFRRLLVHGGRYGLFYAIEGRRIVLHALADLRRNPTQLRQRFRRLLDN